jgi:hypothetical protein
MGLQPFASKLFSIICSAFLRVKLERKNTFGLIEYDFLAHFYISSYIPIGTFDFWSKYSNSRSDRYVDVTVPAPFLLVTKLIYRLRGV